MFIVGNWQFSLLGPKFSSNYGDFFWCVLNLRSLLRKIPLYAVSINCFFFNLPALFKCFDSNGDGHIDLPEFVVAISKCCRLGEEERLKCKRYNHFSYCQKYSHQIMFDS